MVSLTLAALLIGLASYRVWRIIARDQITEPLRHPLIARSDRPVWGWVFDLIDCPWCLGWWLCGGGALMFGLLYDWHPLEGLLVWCAASTVCGFLGKIEKDLDT